MIFWVPRIQNEIESLILLSASWRRESFFSTLFPRSSPSLAFPTPPPTSIPRSKTPPWPRPLGYISLPLLPFGRRTSATRSSGLRVVWSVPRTGSPTRRACTPAHRPKPTSSSRPSSTPLPPPSSRPSWRGDERKEEEEEWDRMVADATPRPRRRNCISWVIWGTGFGIRRANRSAWATGCWGIRAPTPTPPASNSTPKPINGPHSTAKPSSDSSARSTTTPRQRMGLSDWPLWSGHSGWIGTSPVRERLLPSCAPLTVRQRDGTPTGSASRSGFSSPPSIYNRHPIRAPIQYP